MSDTKTDCTLDQFEKAGWDRFGWSYDEYVRMTLQERHDYLSKPGMFEILLNLP